MVNRSVSVKIHVEGERKKRLTCGKMPTKGSLLRRA
jgi:hypothetical protein